MTFDWTAAAIVGATLFGPILAVEIQKRLEDGRETKRRKERLFMTLMATRSVRLSTQHVEALNAIDLTFDDRGAKEEEVRRAWRAYLDELNRRITPDQEPLFQEQRDAKFIDILFAMSQTLRRGYDKTYLKNSWYRPQAHVDTETATQEIQRLFLGILKGERTFPVGINETPPPQAPAIHRQIAGGN